MMNFRTNIPLLALLLMVSGCAFKFDDRTDPVTTNLEFPITGIKLLVRGVDNSYDASTFGQLIYAINDNQQLLVRYERLKQYFHSISTDPGKKVEIQLSLVTETEADLSTLQLCPVVRNWTMHATWQKAHPFGADGVWAKQGGDYKLADCISPTKAGLQLKYNVTSWYINYARGTGENLGLLLISPTNVEIAGDASPGNAPRIFFNNWISH